MGIRDNESHPGTVLSEDTEGKSGKSDIMVLGGFACITYPSSNRNVIANISVLSRCTSTEPWNAISDHIFREAGRFFGDCLDMLDGPAGRRLAGVETPTLLEVDDHC